MRVETRIGVVLLMAAGVTAVLQGQQTTASNGPPEPLKVYLRDYLSRGRKIPPNMTTRITSAEVKTDHGKAEDIVYVSGQGWCGSGGCTLLILEPVESTFKVLGRVPIVQLPVRLLRSSNNGYPDIGVTVRGGGVQAYEAVLSFNGKSYPGNPSLPPARDAMSVQGKVIIASTEGSVLLYH